MSLRDRGHLMSRVRTNPQIQSLSHLDVSRCPVSTLDLDLPFMQTSSPDPFFHLLISQSIVRFYLHKSGTLMQFDPYVLNLSEIEW